MNPHLTYLVADIGSLLVPLLFSFGKRIRFYRQWPRLFAGMIVTAAVFIIWDSYFTKTGVWSFNARYTLPWRLAGLPVEEWIFFFCIPYSCAFIYASLLSLSGIKKRPDNGWKLLAALGWIVLFTGLFFHAKAYTCSALSGCGTGCLLVFLARKKCPYFRADGFLIAYGICLIPFFIVNGILTALPVVMYNNAQNLGIRIFTIPVEDVFYGMLLVLGNVWWLKPAPDLTKSSV